jgi:hypothetical protein
MTPMYLLMGVVHARPWLSLIGEKEGHGGALSVQVPCRTLA